MQNIITDIGTENLGLPVVLALVATLVYYLWRSEQPSGKLSCPEHKASAKDPGNLLEINKNGGLHGFLASNHKKLGPIFSFYWGEELVVSLGSPALFKEVQTLFNRPDRHFAVFKPLFGEQSIEYINSHYGQRQRKVHDRFYSFTAVKSYFSLFVEVGKELVEQWSSIPEGEHIPLREHMLKLACKSVIKIIIPKHYMNEDNDINEFMNSFDLCWDEMVIRLKNDFPEPGSEREKRFEKANENFREKIRKVVRHRQTMNESSTQNFLDALLQDDELNLQEDQIVDNVATYFIGGFHTTGNLLTMLVYFVCNDSEVHKKLIQEIDEVVGDSEIVFEHVEKLKYAKRVIDEALRRTIVSPYAARYSDDDIVVGGHTIPKQTPLILSLGSVLHDERIYPEPMKFDPDRFSAEKAKERRSLSFEPFGFAGKRKCPGYRVVYYESVVFLVEIFRNFDVSIANNKKVEIVHGLVSEPKDEISVTLKPRKT